VFDAHAFLLGLLAVLGLAAAGWLVSLPKRDVSIVDSLWPLFFLLAAAIYALVTPVVSPRDAIVLVLAALWALRLSVYLTRRNWGAPEDHRYRKIRARNEPNFAFKSLYLVFGLQAVLASIVALPLLAALASEAPLGALDYAGVALWAFGFVFETVADAQLARFKRDARNRGRVLEAGLWRYTRHPNYFGECCLWWGLYLIALAAGGWWSIVSPLLMTLLLLKVSGVTLLEADIAERRPSYRDYVARVNSFLPGPPRRAADSR
jgi:steroid 5-alpha reductase family enzyme